MGGIGEQLSFEGVRRMTDFCPEADCLLLVAMADYLPLIQLCRNEFQRPQICKLDVLRQCQYQSVHRHAVGCQKLIVSRPFALRV